METKRPEPAKGEDLAAPRASEVRSGGEGVQGTALPPLGPESMAAALRADAFERRATEADEMGNQGLARWFRKLAARQVNRGAVVEHLARQAIREHACEAYNLNSPEAKP